MSSSAGDSDVNAVRAAGSLFAGFIFSSTLCGLTFFQSYLYFARFSCDPLALRGLVAVLLVLDAGSSGLLTEALYTYLVKHLGSESILGHLLETLCIDFCLTVVVIFVVQVFFVYRVWRASGKSYFLATFVGLFALAAFVFGILLNIDMLQNKSLSRFFDGSLRVWTSAHIGCALVFDVFVAVALFAYLNPATGNPLSFPMSSFERSIFYTLNRGFILIAVQGIYFFLYAPSPKGETWMPFPLFIGGVHINALLGLLNYRDMINGRGFFEEDDITSIPIPSNDGRSPRNPADAFQESKQALSNVHLQRTPTMHKHMSVHDAEHEPVQVTDEEKGRERELGRMRFAVRSFLSMGSGGSTKEDRNSQRESTQSDIYGLGLNLGLPSRFSGSLASKKSKRETPIDLSYSTSRGIMETLNEGEEGRPSGERDRYEHPFARQFYRDSQRQSQRNSQSGSAVLSIMHGYAY